MSFAPWKPPTKFDANVGMNAGSHQQSVAWSDNENLGLSRTYSTRFSSLNLSGVFSGLIYTILIPFPMRRQCCEPCIRAFEAKSHINKSINLLTTCRGRLSGGHAKGGYYSPLHMDMQFGSRGRPVKLTMKSNTGLMSHCRNWVIAL